MATSSVPSHLCFDGVLQYTKLYFTSGLGILGKVAENAEQSAAVVITSTLQLHVDVLENTDALTGLIKLSLHPSLLNPSYLPTHPLLFFLLFFSLLFFSLPPVVLSQTLQRCGANWPIFRLEVRGLISCQWVHMALCPAKLWPGPSLIHTGIPRAAPP